MLFFSQYKFRCKCISLCKWSVFDMIVIVMTMCWNHSVYILPLPCVPETTSVSFKSCRWNSDGWSSLWPNTNTISILLFLTSSVGWPTMLLYVYDYIRNIAQHYCAWLWFVIATIYLSIDAIHILLCVMVSLIFTTYVVWFPLSVTFFDIVMHHQYYDLRYLLSVFIRY